MSLYNIPTLRLYLFFPLGPQRESQDLELLSARQALTLQGAQQVVAVLRGKKLQLAMAFENLWVSIGKSMENN